MNGLPRRGISSIQTLLALPTILSIAWLAVEIGLVIRAMQQASAAADAAALAAAARIPEGFDAMAASAIAAAAACQGPAGPIQLNVGADPSSGTDLQVGLWDRIERKFIPDEDRLQASAVTVRFGPSSVNGSPGFIIPGILDLAEIDFARTSVATWRPWDGTSSLLVLGVFPRGFEFHVLQNARIEAAGGISIAETVGEPATLGTEAVVVTPVLRTASVMDESLYDGVIGDLEPLAAIPTDPFLLTPEPSLLPPADNVILPGPGETLALAPARHPDGLDITTGRLKLLPGVHQFGGVGLRVSGDAEVLLDDAALHLTDAGAVVHVLGSARVEGTGLGGGDWDDVFLISTVGGLVVQDASAIEITGLIHGPGMRVAISDAASVAIDGGVVGNWMQTGDSSVILGRVFVAESESRPGRARLRR